MRRVIRIDSHEHFADYAEPGRMLDDDERFAMTQPRVTYNSVIGVYLYLLSAAAVGAFATMAYYEWIR